MGHIHDKNCHDHHSEESAYEDHDFLDRPEQIGKQLVDLVALKKFSPVEFAEAMSIPRIRDDVMFRVKRMLTPPQMAFEKSEALERMYKDLAQSSVARSNYLDDKHFNYREATLSFMLQSISKGQFIRFLKREITINQLIQMAFVNKGHNNYVVLDDIKDNLPESIKNNLDSKEGNKQLPQHLLENLPPGVEV